MQQVKTSKESLRIYDAIRPRMEELWHKLLSGNYNAATPVAFEAGFIADIDEVLKKLKVKRNIVKHKNVSVIDDKDISTLMKEIERLEKKGKYKKKK